MGEPGVAQLFDQVCLSDEPYLQQTLNGGNLPMVSQKKRRRLEDEANRGRGQRNPQRPIDHAVTSTGLNSNSN